MILRSTFIFLFLPTTQAPASSPSLHTTGSPSASSAPVTSAYQPVFVGDVVRAIIRALDPSIPCATYALAGPRALTVDEFVSLLNHGEAGERHLAAPIAKAIALVAPSLTRAMVDVLAAVSVPDAPPAWGLFGIEPQSLDALYLAGAVSDVGPGPTTRSYRRNSRADCPLRVSFGLPAFEPIRLEESAQDEGVRVDGALGVLLVLGFERDQAAAAVFEGAAEVTVEVKRLPVRMCAGTAARTRSGSSFMK